MSETKRGTVGLSGHFLAMDVYDRPDGSCRGDVVYVESTTTRTTIMSVEHPSIDALIDANVKDGADLIARARERCPAIGLRESAALAVMGLLPFRPSDVACEKCHARPGEGCDGPRTHEDRAGALRHFLIWLFERPVPTVMTKQLISDVVARMGHDVNPYDDRPVIVECASTGECRRSDGRHEVRLVGQRR